MNVIKRICCALGLHNWKLVRDTGVHKYEQCLSCQKRRVVVRYWGHQPRDIKWEETGEFSGGLKTPPSRVQARTYREKLEPPKINCGGGNAKSLSEKTNEKN